MARFVTLMGLMGSFLVSGGGRFSRRSMAFELGSLLVAGFMFINMVPPALEAAGHENRMVQVEAMAKWATTEEIGCLTLNIYRERATMPAFPANEPFDGLLGIGTATKNRLLIDFVQNGQKAPQGYCDVVWAKDQFSWTQWGHYQRFRVNPVNFTELARAYVAAVQVMNDMPMAMAVRERIGMADHYFNPTIVTPGWARQMVDKGMVGNHLFKVDISRNAEKRRAVEAYYWLLTHPVRELLVAMN